MPTFACKFPTCNRPVSAAGEYCADHAAQGKKDEAARHSYYDKYARNKDAKAFYNSAAWKQARTEKLATNPVCERCQTVFAKHVHHIKPLEQCDDDEKLAQDNLKALCHSCHTIEEAKLRADAGSERPFLTGMLRPVEDETYYFDEAAADRAVRFIEKFCVLYEGRHAGKPLLLLDWEKEVIRTLFGWKRRDNGLRRFKTLYLISAKGAGKTPLLAGIGLYMLLGDNEAGPHVISMASSFEQANLTFGAAKKYIENGELHALPGLECQQHKIKAPKDGTWTTISGKPNGRSGPRPSCIIADELHEWPAATAGAFDILRANLFKRSQPLLLMATNAGANKNCFAWTMHERALDVLSGKSTDPELLPVIFEAPKELDWRSEEAAKAANPSIGHFISFEQVKAEQKNGEARYRRLYLSQWVTSTEKWIDSDTWATCEQAIDLEKIADAPLYVGLDMARVDDLCSAVYIYPTKDAFYVRSRFWLPRVTAQYYAEKLDIPYLKWASEGHITLVDEPTISTAVQEAIATELIQDHSEQEITAVCYDRAYSSHTIEALKAAGIECRPIRQGWGIAEGTGEIERRLIDRSIVIEPNPVLRFCAENVEVTGDRNGNRWPVKPNAGKNYEGIRSAKIDGIVAACTGMTEARKHDFPKSNDAEWDGDILCFSSKGVI